MDKSKTQILCPCGISIISGTHIFSSFSFGSLNLSISLLWILFAGSNYTEALFCFIQHKLSSIDLTQKLSSTTQKSHPLCSKYHHFWVLFMFSIDVIKEVLEIGHHIRRRCDLNHLAEAAEPPGTDHPRY